MTVNDSVFSGNRAFERVFHSDQGVEVGLGRNWPLKYKDVMHGLPIKCLLGWAETTIGGALPTFSVVVLPDRGHVSHFEQARQLDRDLGMGPR